MESHAIKPSWLGKRMPAKSLTGMRSIVSDFGLNTVCEGARCPNRAECYGDGTAAFMILGSSCTRDCRFCSIKAGTPDNVDEQEPLRVARAVSRLGLSHVVVTSVTRDDLTDGGARTFAETINAVRSENHGTSCEVLIPDFSGNLDSLDIVLDAGPDILNHNIETVRRLYPLLRPQADYSRSLKVLEHAKNRDFVTKSGLMLGLGEDIEEVLEVLTDLRGVGCDMIVIGQYLQPTRIHPQVVEYIHPGDFEMLGEKARQLGFTHVSSEPYARSSFHAKDFRKVPA